MKRLIFLIIAMILAVPLFAQSGTGGIHRRRVKIGGKSVSSATPNDQDIMVYDIGQNRWVFASNSSGGVDSVNTSSLIHDSLSVVAYIDSNRVKEIIGDSSQNYLVNDEVKLLVHDSLATLDYLHPNEVKSLIGDSLSAHIYMEKENIVSLVHDSLGLYYTKSEANEAIHDSLADYYTKSETDAIIDTKDTNMKNYVKSRGINLVTNGTAFLGDNTNFTLFTYDGAVANGTGGSFRTPVEGYSNRREDELIAVNPFDSYMFKYDIRSDSVTRQYGYIVPYDIDGNQINPDFVMRRAGSDTRLTKALKPGDDYMVVEDASNWSNSSGDPSYKHSFVIWGYKNSFGYKYPDYTYSRYYRTDFWDDGDISNDTIYFKQSLPYGMGNPDNPEREWAIGTAVSNGSSGGTYKYIAASNSPADSTWRTYSGRIGGIDTTGADGTNRFRYGTAFIKVGWLFNYAPSTTCASWVTNVTFEYADYRIKDSYDVSESGEGVPFGAMTSSGNARGSWLTLNPKDYGHNNNDMDVGILFRDYQNSAKYDVWLDASANRMFIDNNNTSSDSKVVFRNPQFNGASEDLAIESDGTIKVRKSLAVGSVASTNTMDVNKAGDGVIIGLGADGNQDGSISVSGGVVSYNTFVGSHYTQLMNGQEEPPKYAVVISNGRTIGNKRYRLTIDTVNYTDAVTLISKRQALRRIKEIVISPSQETTYKWVWRKGKKVRKESILNRTRKRFKWVLKKRCYFDEEVGYYRVHKGLKKLGGYKGKYIKEKRTRIVSLSDYFTYAEGTDKQKDSRVYGVWSGKVMSPEANTSFGDTTKAVYLISQVGLYQVRVTNSRRKIKVGDFLETSNKKYYAQKQNGTRLLNSTLGKSLVNVDWKTIQKDKQLGFKWAIIPILLQ